MANEQTFHVGVKALILDETGRILLLKVNDSVLHDNENGVYWDIPGGRIENGSTIFQTLKREVHEETGIRDFASPKLENAVISNVTIPTDKGRVTRVLETNATPR